jgi:uncharacterized membrane protein
MMSTPCQGDLRRRNGKRKGNSGVSRRAAGAKLLCGKRAGMGYIFQKLSAKIPRRGEVVMENHVSARDRWLGAICYLSILVFIPILSKNKSAFLVRHCRQGFALFFTEIAAFLFLQIVSATVGMIPWLGFLIVMILNLVFFLVFLGVTIMGFVRAMFGEEWRIPYLDEIADRVPID